MEPSTQFLIVIGSILLAAIAADWIGKNSFIPRVTLLMIFGIAVGRHGLALIPPVVTDQFETIANIALLMVGFLIGGKLSQETLNDEIGRIIYISGTAVVVTFSLVTIGLFLTGVPIEIALLLGCIATATAPAATVDVIAELESESPFSNLLAAIVAIDDALGLIVFSIVIAVLAAITGNGTSVSPIQEVIHEVGGAMVLGALIGLPAAYLTGRLRPGQPMLVEALALVFLCGGLAFWLEVSHLIAAITMGMIITNLAKHHEYPFHAIEGVEWVFLIIFFTLAGATLSLDALGEIGVLGVAYILARIFGKILGGHLGAKFGRADPMTQRWIGAAMLPQAGIAVGMALAAATVFPEYRQILLPVVISTTVFFELIGPIFTRLALKRTVDADRSR